MTSSTVAISLLDDHGDHDKVRCHLTVCYCAACRQVVPSFFRSCRPKWAMLCHLTCQILKPIWRALFRVVSCYGPIGFDQASGRTKKPDPTPMTRLEESNLLLTTESTTEDSRP